MIRIGDGLCQLRAEHRRMELLHEACFRAIASDRASFPDLCARLCHRLVVHTLLEAEFLVPVLHECEAESDLVHEIAIEQSLLGALLPELLAGIGNDELTRQRMKVLGQLMREHVWNQERTVFRWAQSRRVDVTAMGSGLSLRRSTLEAHVRAEMCGGPWRGDCPTATGAGESDVPSR